MVDDQELFHRIRIDGRLEPLVVQGVPHRCQLTLDVTTKHEFQRFLVRGHFHARHDPERLPAPSQEILATDSLREPLQI